MFDNKSEQEVIEMVKGLEYDAAICMLRDYAWEWSGKGLIAGKGISDFFKHITATYPELVPVLKEKAKVAYPKPEGNKVE